MNHKRQEAVASIVKEIKSKKEAQTKPNQTKEKKKKIEKKVEKKKGILTTL